MGGLWGKMGMQRGVMGVNEGWVVMGEKWGVHGGGGCVSPQPSSSEASRQSGRRSQRYSPATHSPLPQVNSREVQARGWGVTGFGEGGGRTIRVTPPHPHTPPPRNLGVGGIQDAPVHGTGIYGIYGVV